STLAPPCRSTSTLPLCGKLLFCSMVTEGGYSRSQPFFQPPLCSLSWISTRRLTAWARAVLIAVTRSPVVRRRAPLMDDAWKEGIAYAKSIPATSSEFISSTRVKPRDECPLVRFRAIHTSCVLQQKLSEDERLASLV